MIDASDRVRRHSARAVLERMDQETEDRLAECAAAGPEAIAERMHALEREWDSDRVLETETAAVGLAGLALGLLWRPALAVPGLAAAALLLHALTGRHPTLPLWRRTGVRSAPEVLREFHALEALRGDFDGLDATAAAGCVAADAPPLPASASGGAAAEPWHAGTGVAAEEKTR
ncbi:MAG: hypothetical protein MZW92_41890 [Comamonadaceae bacterium]|nr:hypothetical protein [Comamonadaceae bacterium]